MADEQIIIDVKYDTDESNKQIKELTDSLYKLELATSEMKDANKVMQFQIKDANRDLKKTDEQLHEERKTRSDLEKIIITNTAKIKDNSIKIEENTIKIKGERFERQNHIKLLITEENSRNKLQAKLALMRKEVDALTLSQGKNSDKVKLMNKDIDLLDEQLRNSADGFRKNKIDIGNYAKAFDGMPGPIGRMKTAFTSFFTMMKANPIVLIITTIVGVFTGLFKLFKQHDKFGTQIAGIFDAIKNAASVAAQRIRAFALGFWNLITMNFQEAANQFYLAFHDIGKAIGDAAKRGYEYQQMLDALNDDLLLASVRHEKLRVTIEENRTALKDSNLSIKERSSLAKQALSDMKKLFGEELEFAKRRYDLEFENIYGLAKGKIDISKEEFRLLVEGGKRREELTKKQSDAWDELGDERMLSLLEFYKSQFIAEQNYNKEIRRLVSENSNLSKKDIDEKVEQTKNKVEDLIIEEEKLTEALYELYEQDSQNELGWATWTSSQLKQIKKDRELDELERQKWLSDITQSYLDESFELLALNYDERFQLAQNFTNKILDLQQKILEGEKITADDTKGIAQQLTSDIVSQRNKRLQNEINSLNIGLEKEKQKQENILANFKGTNEEKDKLKAQFDAKNLESEKEIRKKTYEIELKQFKADKAAALIAVAINTIIAVSKVWGQTGIAGIIAQAAPIAMGIVSAALIASKKPPPPPEFAKGGQLKFGTFSGKSHRSGGINLYDDYGNRLANVEGGEKFYVMNKTASSEIEALNQINQRYGGAPLTKKTRFAQEGGEIDMANEIQKTLLNTPIIVQVKDIKTGMADYETVTKAGVV